MFTLVDIIARPAHRLLLAERLSLLSDDPDDYANRAADRAIAGVTSGPARQGGRLLDVDRWVDDDGHWLRIRATIETRPEVEVHYARVLLSSEGPDKDAETEAIIFSSGLEERLHTRAHTLDAVEGVVRL